MAFDNLGAKSVYPSLLPPFLRITVYIVMLLLAGSRQLPQDSLLGVKMRVLLLAVKHLKEFKVVQEACLKHVPLA
jgi:hypothetical protein